MRLKFCALISVLTISITVYSQKVDSDSLIDKMKSEITAFFIQEGLLDRKEVNGSLKFVFATELKQQQALGYSHNGIYRIGVLQSHSKQHILIKENFKYKIFDVDQVYQLLKEVINYSSENKIKAETMFFYIREIMGMYDRNSKTR